MAADHQQIPPEDMTDRELLLAILAMVRKLDAMVGKLDAELEPLRPMVGRLTGRAGRAAAAAVAATMASPVYRNGQRV